MKVGILSMQRIINYGSFLQAYALSNTIRKLGHDVEFVDFKIEPCICDPYVPKKIEDVPEKDRPYFHKVEEFNEKFKNQFLKEIGVDERNERPKVDTLVIGSDEVFNCLQSNPDVGYSLELFGKDNNANKIITYAACCGATTYENLKNYNKEKEVADLLKNFSAISVRDVNTKHFVESLSDIQPINHLDPVLIYDFSNDIVDNVDLKDYIILYGYSFNFSEEDSKLIKEFAQKHNKKIVSVGTWQSCADIYVPAHPLEVFAYFKKADFVITNTFHGTIFAIKNHTPFVTAILNNYNNQKLSDLLERLHFSDRYISSYTEIENKYTQNVDFAECDSILEKERQRSIDYLKNNI